MDEWGPASCVTLPTFAVPRSAFVSSPELSHIGFADPFRRLDRRRSRALVQLIATIALGMSIAIIMATAVSIGLAHAGGEIPPLAARSAASPG